MAQSLTLLSVSEDLQEEMEDMGLEEEEEEMGDVETRNDATTIFKGHSGVCVCEALKLDTHTHACTRFSVLSVPASQWHSGLQWWGGRQSLSLEN